MPVAPNSSGSPRVSVLLPVYDGAATLAQAIDSIRTQTFADFELLIYDDGSRDASLAVAERAAAADPRLRVLRGERNQGLGHAMARLAEAAGGEFLAIHEQDDVSPPDRLAAEVALLDARPEVGLVSGLAEWVDGAGRRLRLFPGLLEGGGNYPQDPAAMVRFLFVEQCKVVNAGCLFRRVALEKIPGRVPVFFDPQARMSVDWQFFLRLAHSWSIWGLPQVVVKMRRGDDRSGLTTRKALQFAEARRCLRLLYRELASHPGSPIDRRLYRRALATQQVLEARHAGGWRGMPQLLGALWRDPGRPDTWRTLGEVGRRGWRRALDLGRRAP